METNETNDEEYEDDESDGDIDWIGDVFNW